MRLESLTEQEKKFAEDNHNLIYGFLHRYRYSIEEWYNVVVFGYLKAVQTYNRRKELQGKYDFPFIAWQYMRSEIGNHFKMQNSQKRKPPQSVISLDSKSEELDNFYNAIGGRSAEDNVMEKLLFDVLLGKLSEVQRKITELKIKGYNNKEVCSMLQIPSSTFYKEMQKIKMAVEQLIA